MSRRYKTTQNKGCLIFCEGDVEQNKNKGCLIFCQGDVKQNKTKVA